MKNKNNTKNRRSMKGKWGKVGAPPKATKFPKTPFTMATLFGRNTNQCELSLRNKVDVMLAAGTLIQLKSRKQAHGAVGRPKAVFIQKANFVASKHEKLGAPAQVKPRKTRSVSTVTATAEATVAPATPPVSIPLNEPEPVLATVEAPIVTETVPQPANVIQAPIEAPAPEQAPIAQAA